MKALLKKLNLGIYKFINKYLQVMSDNLNQFKKIK